jgi:Transposase DDE domain
MVEVQSSRSFAHEELADVYSVERGVRQLLADKVSGSYLGLWLLIPEHLRLGTWDLLCGWTRQPGERVEPRLALQLVHESALCINGLRAQRSLPQKGFALACGLPFVASDASIHNLLEQRSILDTERLQRVLGQLRRASGHYAGQVLVIDPHRLRSYSKRQMRLHRKEPTADAMKVTQAFFALDGDTGQPLGFTTGTASRTVAQATPPLLDLADDILGPRSGKTLVLADAEHFCRELFADLRGRSNYDLLVPLILRKAFLQHLRGLPAERFTCHWAGYATTTMPYTFVKDAAHPLTLFVQRFGEAPAHYKFNAFLCSSPRDEIEALCTDYPKRWHVEEFFNKDQALGWQRAGTQNLNIRYGQMTMALIAQATLHQLRQRLGEPTSQWDAEHLATDLLRGMEGDVRVTSDTIIVTFYNAPHAEKLRQEYQNLPDKLRRENIDPRIPWLYGYQLDYRFR